MAVAASGRRPRKNAIMNLESESMNPPIESGTVNLHCAQAVTSCGASSDVSGSARRPASAKRRVSQTSTASGSVAATLPQK